MWKLAIEDALVKIKQNLKKHPGKLPHIIEGQRYDWGENNDWIEGFYIGMMWLAYEFGQDPFYKEAAEFYLANFKHRLDHHIELDHHDIGFLYSLSAVAQWRVTRNQAARELGLQAADALLARWRPKIGVIQAWGKEDDPENGGRIIIDCLLNLPLLFWAHEQTGDAKYYDVAMKHALQSQKFLVRETGLPIIPSTSTPTMEMPSVEVPIRATGTDRRGPGARHGEFMVLHWLTDIQSMPISWQRRSVWPVILSIVCRRIRSFTGISMFRLRMAHRATARPQRLRRADCLSLLS